MRWYSGDISQAINLAKSKNAIFVVYCAGKNDESTNILSNYINTPEVSSRLKSDAFVAIKIESDKPEYIQFCKIYQLVPIPSLFFIKNGIPVKVITSVVKSLNEIIEAIDGISKNELKSMDIEENVSISQQNEKDVKDLKVECVENDKTNANGMPSASENDSEKQKQEKIQHALKLVEQNRIARIKEEQQLEKEREIKRRKEGQELQNLKKWQDDEEIQQLKNERKKEKFEAMEARRRVLEQIEEDKKERSRKFNTAYPLADSENVKKPTYEIPSVQSDIAKIQFKKPDGETEIVTFDNSMLFGDLYSFVKSDLLQGLNIKEFTLATTFPRREFNAEDFRKTLLDLKLVPSSVLLIIPGKNGEDNKNSRLVSANGIFNMISALFIGLVSPIWTVFGYIKNFVLRNNQNKTDNDVGKRKRDEEALMANDAAKKRNMEAYNQPSTSQTGAIPKTKIYKRINPMNNIHRLHQDSDSDSEDERKTYNGNSTQQM